MAGWCVLCPVLLAVGVVSNVLIFKVVGGALCWTTRSAGRRVSTGSSTLTTSCLLILVIALTDLLYLHVHLLPRWLYEQYEYRLDTLDYILCLGLKWLAPSLELMKPWLIAALACHHALVFLPNCRRGHRAERQPQSSLSAMTFIVVVIVSVSLLCNLHYALHAQVVTVSVFLQQRAHGRRKDALFCITDYFSQTDTFHLFLRYVWDVLLKHVVYFVLPSLTLFAATVLILVRVKGILAGSSGLNTDSDLEPASGSDKKSSLVRPAERECGTSAGDMDHDNTVASGDPLPYMSPQEVLSLVYEPGDCPPSGKKRETEDGSLIEKEEHIPDLLENGTKQSRERKLGEELFTAPSPSVPPVMNLTLIVLALATLYLVLEAPLSLWPFMCEPGTEFFHLPAAFEPSLQTYRTVDRVVSVLAYVSSASKLFIYLALDRGFRWRVKGLFRCPIPKFFRVFASRKK